MKFIEIKLVIGNYLRGKMHKKIKETLGYKGTDKEEEILSDWKSRTNNLCKPCWELNYCPYGPFVEEFPLLPVPIKQAECHNEYFKKCLSTRILGSGEPLDENRRSFFEQQIKVFNKADYPDKIPKILKEASCNVFGHICPVFFVAEPLTETKNRRTHSRHIPRDIMIKVIRRDGQVCQKCQQLVPDDEVEFDHIIPYSKGGTSTVNNLRVVHKQCNRTKSNSLDEILHENPIQHLWELREESQKTSDNSE